MHLLLLLAAAARAAPTYRTDAELRAEYGPPVPLPPPRYLTASPLRAGAPTTLRAAAAARGLFVGAAINEACWVNASEPYASTYLAELDLATCENGCKFAALEPQQGAFNFQECDFISQKALVDGKGAFRGHNFVWGEGIPSWVANGGFSPSALRGVMEGHISAALAHYAGSPPPFECWDVVNEAVCDTGSKAFNCSSPQTLWKTNTWTPAGAGAAGGYVELAFAAAARGARGGEKLFYNDYGGEAAGTTKSDKIYAMLRDFKQRGVPVSGVGLQMHISVDGYPSPWDVAANIKRLGELGLEVHITEMDVRCSGCSDARLQLQAAVYGHMLQACLNNSGVCRSFETWGFTDRHTWLSDFDNPTHEDVMPLPWDVVRAGGGAGKHWGPGVGATPPHTHTHTHSTQHKRAHTTKPRTEAPLTPLFHAPQNYLKKPAYHELLAVLNA